MSLTKDELLTDCERSKRYHNARLRFYGTIHRWILLLIVLAGVLAISPWLGTHAAYFSGFTVALSLFSLVFNFIGMTHLHTSLYQRSAYLNGDIESRIEPKEQDLERWTREIHNIYADEPPIYRVLHQHCANQVLQSLHKKGTKEYEEDYVHIGFFRRLLMNWCLFNGYTPPKKKRSNEQLLPSPQP